MVMLVPIRMPKPRARRHLACARSPPGVGTRRRVGEGT